MSETRPTTSLGVDGSRPTTNLGTEPSVSKIAGSRRVDRAKLKQRKQIAEAARESARDAVRLSLLHEVLVALDPRFAAFGHEALAKAKKKEEEAYYKIMSIIIALHGTELERAAGDDARSESEDDGSGKSIKPSDAEQPEEAQACNGNDGASD